MLRGCITGLQGFGFQGFGFQGWGFRSDTTWECLRLGKPFKTFRGEFLDSASRYQVTSAKGRVGEWILVIISLKNLRNTPTIVPYS